MIADDWKVLMQALSIRVQGIHFSKGTTQREKDAIADYMIGVADAIEAYPVPLPIQAISDCSDEQLRRLKAAELQISEIPKKILAAVNAEQLRCGHIAEAFWNEGDKLNADLRVPLTQAEKSMAYMISTNIRAMRWREENFAEKRNHDLPKCFLCGEAAVGKVGAEPRCERHV